VEEQLTAGLGKWQVAEFVEDDEVLADQIIGNLALQAFNVRVAIVEPGVIATPLFSKARPVPPDSPYPHLRRQRALFSASLTQPTSPFVVAEKICEIVDSVGWQLRYPVGPDAEPFLKWRTSKTDEEIVQLGGATDDEFKSIVKRDFGLDVVL